MKQLIAAALLGVSLLVTAGCETPISRELKPL